MRELLSFERTSPEPGRDADAQRHEWVARVDVADPAGATLEIGGIATVWDVLVNGTLVASGTSMFERRLVGVAAALATGTNEVRVVVHPLTDLLDAVPRKPRARWRTMLVDEARLRWARTQVLGRAPGFAPGPPVVGPHRPMVLATEPAPAVERTGTWWPHSHGDPSPTGHRTVENRSADSLALWVNGEQVFVRGAVWTPGDLTALDTAVELGLNLVRVTGISAYESDAFYARCDELGLMVWQDLMFATFDYPLADEGFRAAVEAEVRDQLARLREHPCVVVVCGSAEHEQQAAMFGIRPETGSAAELAAFLRPLVEESGIEAVWVDSSPSGGDLPIRVDTGVAQYFGVGAYLRDLPDVRHSGVRFASECLAFANLPDPVGPDETAGVPQDNGADWDFADVREHYARERYGVEATVAQRQRVTGEVMADVFGEWRRPDSACGGGIVLWLRDLEPGAGWGLLDHTGAPKPAALALAPTLQPTAVWFVDEGLNGLDVHVAHDRWFAADLHLTVDLLRHDGSVLESVEESWRMEPHGHRHWTVDTLLGRFADSSYAYRFGPPPHDAVRARLTADDGTNREATWRVRV